MDALPFFPGVAHVELGPIQGILQSCRQKQFLGERKPCGKASLDREIMSGLFQEVFNRIFLGDGIVWRRIARRIVVRLINGTGGSALIAGRL